MRLVEGAFETTGKSRARPLPVERVSSAAIRSWPVASTPVGPRRRSPPFETSVERADTLVIELAPGGPSALDVTVAPASGSLTAVEMLHRTIRLEAPDASATSRVVQVALGPILRGTWSDAGGSAHDRFRVEIDAEIDPAALRAVEVRPRDSRFHGTNEPRVDGPPGTLRPSFHLQVGTSLLLPIAPAARPRTLVFHLHAPLGQPEVEVHRPGELASVGPLAAPRDGWRRHELRIPAGQMGEVRFEAVGKGVVLIGDPTLWPEPEGERPPDVVIYMVDTLLASRLGALGNQVPGVSPAMDSLIESGLSFVRATSTSAWTKPAIPSLLTGVYPLTHRIGTRNYTDRLPDRVPMLQERFREAGFRTVSSSASPLGSTLSGLERGFDLAHPPAFWSDALGPLGHPDARQVQAALLAFIDEDPTRPAFAYLHTLDVHEYERPMFASGAATEKPYDRAIRHQDAALQDLLATYRARNRDLILVLVSDHGEGFGEYGLKVGHGYSVRQNQLHVPLVFHGPRWLPSGRVTEPASLVDIAPTLLDLFSLPALPGAQGRSLLRRHAEAEPRAVYAERTWFLWEPEAPKLLARLGSDGQKLVTGYAQPVSWDLVGSPCEDTEHGMRPNPQHLNELEHFITDQAQAAEQWEAAYGESSAAPIDPDDIARLRALGYLQ